MQSLVDPVLIENSLSLPLSLWLPTQPVHLKHVNSKRNKFKVLLHAFEHPFEFSRPSESTI